MEYRKNYRSWEGYTRVHGDSQEYKEIHRRLRVTWKFKGLYKRSKGALVNKGN